MGVLEGEPTCTPDSEIYDIWPKFLVIVLLQGAQRFVIDNTTFSIDAGFGEAATPLVFLLNVARPSKLRFVNDSDVPLRKVQISAPRAWVDHLCGIQIESEPALRGFFAQHLAQFSFMPCRQALRSAEDIMKPPPSLVGETCALYRQARALDIMCAACAALVEEGEDRRKPLLSGKRQSERVRDYVLGNLDKPLTIDAVARHVGASISSVQRHFKEHFGMTVFEFIRDSRLARAHDALDRNGITIAQAAWVAGYANPSSFATAFKKAYGIPPRCRRR